MLIIKRLKTAHLAGLRNGKNKYDFMFLFILSLIHPHVHPSPVQTKEKFKGKHPRNSKKLWSLHVTYGYKGVLSFLYQLNLQPTQLTALYSTLLPLTDGGHNHHIFQTIRNIFSWNIMHTTFLHFHGLKLSIWPSNKCDSCIFWMVTVIHSCNKADKASLFLTPVAQ